MSLKIAVQMEPLVGINTKTNLPLYLSYGARQRGYEVQYYNVESLTYDGTKLTAMGHDFLFRDQDVSQFYIENPREIVLNDYDVVLMMQNASFDMTYITACHLLRKIHPDTLVLNNPCQVREACGKIFMNHLEHLMPPTMITSQVDEIDAFVTEHQDVVIKPLFEMRGNGVFRLRPNDPNLKSYVELMRRNYCSQWMVQRYIPEVKQGDKKIYVLDGEFVGGLNRIPNDHELRATTYTGGRVELLELTDNDRHIIAEACKVLQEKDILIAAMDVIGPYITEINIDSPGGIGYANKFFDTSIEQRFWDIVEVRIKNGTRAC